jgi:hypothetical protein
MPRKLYYGLRYEVCGMSIEFLVPILGGGSGGFKDVCMLEYYNLCYVLEIEHIDNLNIDLSNN